MIRPAVMTLIVAALCRRPLVPCRQRRGEGELGSKCRPAREKWVKKEGATRFTTTKKFRPERSAALTSPSRRLPATIRHVGIELLQRTARLAELTGIEEFHK